MSLQEVGMNYDRSGQEFNSQMMLSNIAVDKAPEVKFSFGYNEGRNRRDLLALFPDSSFAFTPISFITMPSLSFYSDHNTLNFDFLKTRCRPVSNGRFYLDLRGSAMEKHFKRRFNDEDLETLFEFIEKRPEISGLHLAYNNLTNYGFEKLSVFLVNVDNIHYVNVMNNDIKYLDPIRLEEVFIKWNVSCLNIRGNKIGRRGGETMAYLLTKNTSIKHLSLGETDQNVNAIISIVNTLVQFNGNNTLTKLDLTKTLVTTNASELCRHLACVLEVNRSLVELVLSKNDITDADLEILLEGLKYGTVLSLLNLSCNRISSFGAELIAEILPKTEIKFLVLATNMIGDSGAMALGRVFAFSKLTFLDVSRNHIGDLGIIPLTWAICRRMDGFFIYGNKFTDHACKVIYAQVIELAIDPKTLDIRFWFDEQLNIRYTRRNIWSYSEWYYFVPEWNNRSAIQHCCCPIRGGIMAQLKSND